MKFFFFLSLLFSSLAWSSEDVLQPLKSIPIQDSGRIKPLDTFARESLSLIYGKETYEGKAAIEVFMTWILEPQAWENRDFVEIRYSLVKKALHFEETQKYFSLQNIMASERLSYVMQELQSKREMKEKLDPYFQALQRLEGQIGIFHAIASGEIMRLVPPGVAELSASAPWLGPKSWTPEQTEAFANISRSFIQYLALKNAQDESPEHLSSVAEILQKSANQFMSLAKESNPSRYADFDRIHAELNYTWLHPFQKAWIFYLCSVLAMLLLWIFKAHKLYWLSWFLALCGLGMHLTGFAMRIYLTGRPPVSNMYETVVWVSFGAMVFSMIIEAVYRWKFILPAGAMVSAFCLILSDFAPVILDPSLQPLEAVLNSQFWLTTHVLTITISYAAFFLAFALGDFGLYFYFKGEEENSPRLRAITLSIYRAIQIGVSLLAPGIILGGIWADYSWGRFWGWDPKETWALIALLGYIAVLHGRVGGLLKGFGLVASSVVTFSLVIMAWYGVNFVLGAGLHSYGFGAGGVEYVATFVGIHLVAVVFVSVLHHSRKKQLKS